jgi:fatty-acyl-CoA synthase
VLVRCEETTGEILRNSKGFCDKIEKPGQKGIFLGHINPIFAFDGYVDKAATQKKVLTDAFKKGDAYFNTGDILILHDDGWVSFADRVGDTYRWKGENVSTNEVAEALNRVTGVLESNVYGVEVVGSEGRAGMASLSVNESFKVEELAKYVVEKLPAFQRPYFVRLSRDMRITGTFKHQKVTYRDEGYDPAKVEEPLYFLDGKNYVEIDAELHRRLMSGEVGPR